MSNYSFSHKAVEDLANIYEYTFGFWSAARAEKYYYELIGYCKMLAENPRSGKNYPEIDSSIYGFLANKHLIFYRIIDREAIEIVRILGADMDLKNRIQE